MQQWVGRGRRGGREAEERGFNQISTNRKMTKKNNKTSTNRKIITYLVGNNVARKTIKSYLIIVTV